MGNIARANDGQADTAGGRISLRPVRPSDGRRSMRPIALATPILLASMAGGVHAQTNEELKAKLDEALKTIQDLQGRVKALEQGKSAPAPAAAAATPGATAGPLQWGAPVAAPATKAEPGTPDADKARVEVYGQVMLDTIYDFKRMDPDWNATLRPSKIPVVCPGSAGCGQDGAWIFSARQSSLGLRSFIPTSLGLLKTDLSFDLFASDGSTSIHWMHIWAEMGMFGAGQTESLFMDIDAFPNTIDYWGPSGMVFVRNPQLRITPWSTETASLSFSLEAPNSAIDTGKITEIAPEFGAGFTGWNRLPDLVGAYRLTGDWGHFRAAGILRQVGFQNTLSADGDPSGTKTGYGLNLSGTLKVLGNDTISWQLAYGEAIASYMDDGGVDLAPGPGLRAETVSSLGWFAYYNHAWTDQWSSAIGYSQHQQDNTEGQLGSAFRRGSYGNLNLLYTPAKNWLTGLELIYGKLEQKDGASATDYRLQFSTKLKF